jgi:ElaB/YqjD/DUF883 family membrane-anchored ribosome-binding protein
MQFQFQERKDLAMSTIQRNEAARQDHKIRGRVEAIASSVQEAAQDIKRTTQQHGSEVAEHVRGLGGDVKQAAQDRVAEVSQVAHEQFEQARDTAGEYLERGRDRAVELEHSLESQIRSRPMRSMLVAAGVGFAIGFLLIRR